MRVIAVQADEHALVAGRDFPDLIDDGLVDA